MACTAKGICTMRIHALPTIRTKKNPQRTRKPRGKNPCKITLRHQMVLYAKHKLHTHAPNTNNAHMHTHTLHHTERTHTHYTTQNVDTLRRSSFHCSLEAHDGLYSERNMHDAYTRFAHDTHKKKPTTHEKTTREKPMQNHSSAPNGALRKTQTTHTCTKHKQCTHAHTHTTPHRTYTHTLHHTERRHT